MTSVEKQHIVESFNFHLGKVKSPSVRQQNVEMFAKVDEGLAATIAENIGVNPPSASQVPNNKKSPALSQANTPHYAYTQKIGVLIGDGFIGKEVSQVIHTLEEHGVFVTIVSEKLGDVTGEDGVTIKVDQTFLTTHPVLFDSFYIVGGRSNNKARFKQDMMTFVSEAYKAYKPIGVATTGQDYVNASDKNSLAGVVFAANNPNFGEEFVKAIAQQRFWNRK